MINMKEPSILVDPDAKKNKKLLRLYDVSAKVALKYGALDRKTPENRIKEFWTYDNYPPSSRLVESNVDRQTLKKYINEVMSLSHPIWSADFLGGVSKNAKLKEDVCNRFPSLEWSHQSRMGDLLSASPFYGKTSKSYAQGGRAMWSHSAALCLNYSEDTIPFMAGLLACGVPFVHDGISYIRYPKRVSSYIKKWNIPIEDDAPYINESIMLSPIWPAIFSVYMPTMIQDSFKNLENAARANVYAPVLWRMYGSNRFFRRAIPYLKSERMIFYEYKCEEGAIKRLRKIWVNENLVALDLKIKDVIQKWVKNLYNSMEEKNEH